MGFFPCSCGKKQNKTKPESVCKVNSDILATDLLNELTVTDHHQLIFAQRFLLKLLEGGGVFVCLFVQIQCSVLINVLVDKENRFLLCFTKGLDARADMSHRMCVCKRGQWERAKLFVCRERGFLSAKQRREGVKAPDTSILELQPWLEDGDQSPFVLAEAMISCQLCHASVPVSELPQTT